MAARYSVAVDTLADNLKWILSRKGIDVLHARAEYLTKHKLTPTSADDARATIVSILSEAEPVFWPTKFCDIIEQSFATLPTSWRLTDPMLFTPHGFAHFETPISLVSSHPSDESCMGKHDRVAGIGWRKARGTIFVDMNAWVIPGDESLMEVFPSDWMIKRVSDKTFATLDRLVRKSKDREAQQKIREVESFIGRVEAGLDDIENSLPLVDPLLNVVTEALDAEQDRYRNLMIDALREVGVVRPGGVPWMVTPWRSGQTIEQTSEVHAAAISAPDEACFYCTEAYLKLYATTLNFLATKVFVSVPSHTDRTVLRRLVRTQTRKPQWDSVNVISMRRPERVKHESDEEHKPVDWSCHWLVGSASGGFWRHQPMKNEKGEWVKYWRWIFPYVKGNLDKPFKPPGKRVFDVRR